MWCCWTQNHLLLAVAPCRDEKQKQLRSHERNVPTLSLLSLSFLFFFFFLQADDTESAVNKDFRFYLTAGCFYFSVWRLMLLTCSLLLSAVLAQGLFQLRGVQDGAEHDDLQRLWEETLLQYVSVLPITVTGRILTIYSPFPLSQFIVDLRCVSSQTKHVVTRADVYFRSCWDTRADGERCCVQRRRGKKGKRRVDGSNHVTPTDPQFNLSWPTFAQLWLFRSASPLRGDTRWPKFTEEAKRNL